ncbi:MAG: response regulator [Rhodocyclaceae bacterium]|nr:response regulator [Rhodocyclaceae bacterium]
MQQKRVLIIDDVAIIRAYVKAALKDETLLVVEAGSGQQALDTLAIAPVDLILCDVNMPGMNGHDFVVRLRKQGNRTPLIMLTAEGDRDIIGKLIQLGIQGYILKPFKPAVLLARVVEQLFGPDARSAGEPAPESPQTARGD